MGFLEVYGGVNVGLREGHGCSFSFSFSFLHAGGLGSEAFSVILEGI